MFLPLFTPLGDVSNYSFLQPDILNKTNELISSINQSDEEWQFTDEEYYFARERNHQLREMRAWLLSRKPRKGNFQFNIEQIASLEKSIKHKQKWHRWINDQKDIIHNALTKFNDTQSALKTLWHKHRHLIKNNHTSICMIASELLPKLIKHHQYASEWLEGKERFNKPKQILLNYRKYLDDFFQASRKLQQALAETMLLRLIAFDESHFKHSHPIVYFTQKLSSHGLLQSQENMSDPCQLSDKQFNYFHWYIEKYGTTELKDNLLQLSWYKNKNDLPLKIMVTAEGSLLVPEQIAPQIPFKRAWPAWLFKSYNLRLKLAQSSNYLVAMLNQRRDLSQYFVDVTISQSYQYLFDELQQKENQIQNALDKIESHLDGYRGIISSFIFSQTKQNLLNWKNYFINNQLLIFEDKLTLCEKLLSTMPKAENDGRNETLLDKQTVHLLEHIIAELNRQSKCLAVTALLNERLQKLHESICDIINLNKVLLGVNALATSNKIDSTLSYFLAHYFKSLEKRDRASILLIKELCERYLKSIYHKLIQAIKSCRLPFDIQNIFTRIEQLNCCYQVINILGTEQMRKSISHRMKKLFLQYLQSCLAVHNKISVSYEYSEYLKFCECILQTLGASIYFAGNTIAEHFQGLLDMQNANKMVWQIRAQGLIETLTNDLMEIRFNKEARLFDRKLFKLLQEHKPTHFNEATVKLLQTIRIKLIKKNIAWADAIESLSKAEQMLLGACNSGDQNIADIVIATADIWRAQKKVVDYGLELPEKIQTIKLLSNSIHQFLRLNSITKNISTIQAPSSKNKSWFNKIYIDEALVMQNNNIFVI